MRLHCTMLYFFRFLARRHWLRVLFLHSMPIRSSYLTLWTTPPLTSFSVSYTRQFSLSTIIMFVNSMREVLVQIPWQDYYSCLWVLFFSFCLLLSEWPGWSGQPLNSMRLCVITLRAIANSTVVQAHSRYLRCSLYQPAGRLPMLLPPIHW